MISIYMRARQAQPILPLIMIYIYMRARQAQPILPYYDIYIHACTSGTAYTSLL